MSAPPGHVLVISFGYAPLEHVSATRAVHMARELGELGWEVSVLTVDWSEPLPERVASIGESVRRALASPSPRRVAVDARLGNPAFEPHALFPTSEPPPPRSAWLRRLATLRHTLSWGPYASWARSAFAAAAHLHRERPLDVVWAIHGDDSCHAIAHRLNRRLGIPWVADFKDPWSFAHAREARAVQRFATARRLRTARAVTETCAAQAEADRRDFAARVHVVYSGYDAGLMAAAPPERPGPEFCISYPGSIAPPHDVRLLPGVFAALRERGTLGRLEVGVHQYARPAGQLRTHLEQAGCASLLRDHDRVPRARAFSLMRGSDVLLVFPMTRLALKWVGLKEIESLASGTPVLMLGEPLGELRPLLAACPQARVARSAAEGADFLEREALQFLERGRSATRAEANAPALRAFTWSAQAAVLSRILAGSA